MKRASASVAISFGVVPEEIRAWKPDTAPQAMVMNRNGKSEPDQTGPVPSTNLVTAGILSCGATTTIPIASPTMVPILRKVER
jgi:hypothetical protein